MEMNIRKFDCVLREDCGLQIILAITGKQAILRAEVMDEIAEEEWGNWEEQSFKDGTLGNS